MVPSSVTKWPTFQSASGPAESSPDTRYASTSGADGCDPQNGPVERLAASDTGDDAEQAMSSTARVLATVNGPAIGTAVTTPAPISSIARTMPAAAVPERC